MNKPSVLRPVRQQEGATLVVALLILLVMTLFGVSNFKSSTLQTTMSRYSENREKAFMLAELALKEAEETLRAGSHDIDSVQDCASGTSTCYDEECAGGKCFNGDYSAGFNPWECKLEPPAKPHWAGSTLNVWDTAARHQLGDNEGYPGFDKPKYITEFLCYGSVDYDAGRACSSSNSSSDDCVALYRVTAFATSRDGKARVMLQSVTKVDSL